MGLYVEAVLIGIDAEFRRFRRRLADEAGDALLFGFIQPFRDAEEKRHDLDLLQVFF